MKNREEEVCFVDNEWADVQAHLRAWYDNDFWRGYDARPEYVWWRWARWHLEFMMGFYEPPNGASGLPAALDLGGGYMIDALQKMGLLSAFMRRLGACYSLIDPEAEWVRRAKGHLSEYDGVMFRCAPCERPFPAPVHGGFDVVLSLGALDHMVSPLQVLKNARSALRPDGRLFLGVGAFRDDVPFDTDDDTATWQWKKKGLVEMVETAGLTVRRAEESNILRMKKAALVYIEATPK